MSIPIYCLCCIVAYAVWFWFNTVLENYFNRPPRPMQVDTRWPVAGTLLALLYFGGIPGLGVYCILSRAQ
jgi:hypothetical protein